MDANQGSPAQAAEAGAVTNTEGGRPSRLFHPASGAVILAIDWLLFSGNIVSGGLATLPTMLIGFALGGLATGLVQRFVAGDGTAKSLVKALAAGLLVGIPTPVAGTALGSAILAFSGLSSRNRKPSSGPS